MIESAARRLPVRAAIALVVACLSGCVSEGNAGRSTAQASLASSDPQPGRATYACEDNTMITVDNRVSEVTVTDSEGDVSTLPAAPAEQRSRYGIEGMAIVLDGLDALFMKGRHEPLNCRR
ncbi:MAG: hypothetical protein KF914_12555 [Rhizobiaceae bacterium]|nr:hypothetical protein [Rhizobiaceae bacterium]